MAKSSTWWALVAMAALLVLPWVIIMYRHALHDKLEELGHLQSILSIHYNRRPTKGADSSATGIELERLSVTNSSKVEKIKKLRFCVFHFIILVVLLS